MMVMVVDFVFLVVVVGVDVLSNVVVMLRMIVSVTACGCAHCWWGRCQVGSGAVALVTVVSRVLMTMLVLMVVVTVIVAVVMVIIAVLMTVMIIVSVLVVVMTVVVVIMAMLVVVVMPVTVAMGNLI